MLLSLEVTRGRRRATHTTMAKGPADQLRAAIERERARARDLLAESMRTVGCGSVREAAHLHAESERAERRAEAMERLLHLHAA